MTPEGLRLDLGQDLGGGARLITAHPTREDSATAAILALLTGPLKQFSDKVDAVLAAQGKRIKELEAEVAALKVGEPRKRGRRAHR